MLDGEQLLLPFEAPEPPSPHAGEALHRLDPDALTQYIRRRGTYATPRMRQGVRDRRAASRLEVESLGRALLQAAPTDPTALLAMVAALGGVTPTLAQSILVAEPGDSDWTVFLCLETGSLHTNVDAIFPGAARQRDFLQSRPATRIVSKPLPRQIVDLLRQRSGATPNAATLGDLLPGASTDTRRPLLKAQGERLRATYARFREGLGPLALELEISNYVAALVLNHFALIPKSRLFYADCDPEAISDAAIAVYRALGWGEPVAFEATRPFGALTRPSRSDVVAAYRWYRSEVADTRPANRTSIPALLRFHDVFIRAAAFVIAFVIGARAVRCLDVTSEMLLTVADSFPFHDKRAPRTPIDHDVTAGPIVAEQLQRVRAHLHALRRRLDHLGQAPGSKIMRYLEKSLAGEAVPLFCELSRPRSPHALSTQAIFDPLPASHRIVGNAGRSFWQSEAQVHGLSSADISLFARHTTVGCEPNTTTSVQSLDQRRDRLIEVQQRVLGEMGFEPIPGLTRRPPPARPQIDVPVHVVYTARPPGAPLYIKRRTDPVRRTHYHATEGASAARMRFRRLQIALIHGDVIPPEEAGFIALALIAFDGVIHTDTLEPALGALPTAYRSDDGLLIEWRASDGRLERRLLSAITAIALGKCGMRHPHAQIAGMAARLRTWDVTYAFADPSAVIGQLMDDATAWYFASIPPVLVGHLRGDAPLAAAPRSALARRTARQALAARRVQDDPGTGMAWNVYFAGPCDNDDEFVEQLRAVCRPTGKADHLDRQRMLADARALLPVTAQAGRWSSLLCGWVIHLVANGTRQTPTLAASTIEAYVGQTVAPLYSHLSSLGDEDLETVDLEALYARVVMDVEPSQIGKVEAALSAFHDFLMDYLDLAAPPHHVSPEENRAPRAHVLWPHELRLVDGWLSDAARADRLAAQARTAFAIARAMPVRAGELATLRMSAIRGNADALDVAIDPPFGSKSPKTPAGRRIVPIADPGCRNTLLTWLGRRRSEGALPNDRLFGDPYQPNEPYRWGETLQLVSRCMKAATGDSTVSFHALRHSVVSQRCLKLALSGAEQRDFEQLSAWAGHESAATTFRQYFHLYEPWLRRSLDRMLDTIPLTERHFAQWAGCAFGTLRQRAHRHATALADTGWRAIRDAAATIAMPEAGAGFGFVVPLAPLMRNPAACTFDTIESALLDLAEGRSIDAIALRLDRPSNLIERIIRVLDQFIERNLGRARLPRRREIDPNLADRLAALSCAPNLRRIEQPKYACLRRWLRTTADTAALLDATLAWQHCVVGRYLALEDRQAISPLLGLMRDAGVRGRQLVVCADEADADASAHTDIDVASTVRRITMQFGEAPTLRRLRSRPARPRVHLLLQDENAQANAGISAGGSIAGLHALLLVAWIHARLNKHEETQ